MRYKKWILKISAAFLVCIFGVTYFTYSQVKPNTSLPKENEVQTTITYCDLSLSEKWKLGNLSFNSLYSFAVDDKGEIKDIKKIRDNFIGEDSVRSCIAKWKILGFPENSRFSVYFVWQHGKGWIRQEVSGKGFTQVMTMENIGVEKLEKPKKEEKP